MGLPVEVFASAKGNESVRVCESREDANPVPDMSIRTTFLRAYTRHMRSQSKALELLYHMWICAEGSNLLIGVLELRSDGHALWWLVMYSR